MTDKVNRNEISQRERRQVKGRSTRTWQIEEAGRFLFKAQCYDAGPDSETTCGLCGERIRLCYVLKVLESADPLAPEVGKLTIGECCFKPIKAINEKLYRQLLAAAINLRTFIEAVERDKQVFAGGGSAKTVPLPVSVRVDEELTCGMIERSIAEGGNHA